MQAGLGRVVPLSILFLGSLAAAQDSQISALAKTVLSLREYVASNSGVREVCPNSPSPSTSSATGLNLASPRFPRKGTSARSPPISWPDSKAPISSATTPATASPPPSASSTRSWSIVSVDS